MTRLPMICLLLSAATAHAQDRIPSHCVSLASGPERVMRAAIGDPLAQDYVRIQYLTHASFAIETHGGLVAVTDYTGYVGAGDVVPDVATMNNAHSTHWTARPDPRIPHVLQGWAGPEGPAVHALDLGQMFIRNVPTDVRSNYDDGVRRDGNSIFVFEAGGLCIGHLGHLHHMPSDDQFAVLGRMDVVMVPVDGGYTMAVADMAKVVRRLRSSVVIPMHWFSGASLDVFLAEMAGSFEVVETGGPDIELSRFTLPGRPTILVLEPQFLD